MTKRTLPAIRALTARDGDDYVCSPNVVKRWRPMLALAEGEGKNVITILDPIGADMFGNGVTARRIEAALRSLKGQDVVVHINSPGGDVFEGMAIYNLLRDHDGAVTVKVLGLAASAASIIAMAGDTIQIARAGFIMIHNAWALVVGNRHDMTETAAMLEEVDAAMVEVYAARSGMEPRELARMMDREAMVSGSSAVEKGLADSLLPADQISESKSAPAKAAHGVRLAEAYLARAGVPRSERQEFIRALRDADPTSGLRDAAEHGESLADPLADLRSITLT